MIKAHITVASKDPPRQGKEVEDATRKAGLEFLATVKDSLEKAKGVQVEDPGSPPWLDNRETYAAFNLRDPKTNRRYTVVITPGPIEKTGNWSKG